MDRRTAYYRFVRRPAAALFFLSFVAVSGGMAAENGVSVYPAGVETIMPGVMPPSGKTLLLEFNNFYQANGLMDSSGRSLVPGFHLRVAAFAPKLVHNWGVRVLGGSLVSSAAFPILYEHLTGPFGSLHKSGLSNPDIGVAAVAYHKGAWHWWYGIDEYLPGAQYKKEDILNIGQHYFATAPEAAFTYMPRHGRNEVSSKFQYIVNGVNGANQYRSGQEFVWEYAAIQNVTRNLSLGVNGYYYRQTTGDRQNGAVVEDGLRGRAFAAGPQIQFRLGEVALILKYQKEALVQNRTAGNSFWLQVGVPLWHHEQ